MTVIIVPVNAEREQISLPRSLRVSGSRERTGCGPVTIHKKTRSALTASDGKKSRQTDQTGRLKGKDKTDQHEMNGKQSCGFGGYF